MRISSKGAIITAYFILKMILITNAQSKTEYWTNHNKKSYGKMRNGQKVGLWKYWYEGGQLEAVARLKSTRDKWPSGNITGFYKTGEKMYQLNFIHDKNAEVRTVFSINGSIISEAKSYMSDKKKGLIIATETCFYETGNKKSEEIIDLTKKEWSYKEYNLTGATIKTGKIIGIDSTSHRLKPASVLNELLPVVESKGIWINTVLVSVDKVFKNDSYYGSYVENNQEENPTLTIYLNSNKKETHIIKYDTTNINISIDSCFKNDTLYDSWHYRYGADTLMYAINYYLSDTFFIYPVNVQTIGYECCCPSCINAISIANISVFNSRLFEKRQMPYKLPDSYPDGKWLLMYDTTFFKTSSEQRDFLKNSNIQRRIVAGEFIYKNNLLNGPFYKYSIRTAGTNINNNSPTSGVDGIPINANMNEYCDFYESNYTDPDTTKHFIKNDLFESGTYTNGRLNGKHYHWFFNRRSSESNFVNDTLDGESLCLITMENRVYNRINFKMGKWDGLHERFYCTTGKPRYHGNYKNNLKEGLWNYWTENGYLSKQTQYLHDKLIKEIIYKENKVAKTILYTKVVTRESIDYYKGYTIYSDGRREEFNQINTLK